MRTTVVVIGGGQAGLAMSWWLTRAGVDHVVLERGVVAQSWRDAALGLAAAAHPELDEPAAGARVRRRRPRRLPSARARSSTSSTATPARSTPRCARTPRSSGCGRTASGFQVDTDGGSWRCRAVVVATGTEGESRLPALARDLPGRPAADHRAAATASPGRSRRARCWSWAPRRRACRSPTSCGGPGGR